MSDIFLLKFFKFAHHLGCGLLENKMEAYVVVVKDENRPVKLCSLITFFKL